MTFPLTLLVETTPADDIAEPPLGDPLRDKLQAGATRAIIDALATAEEHGLNEHLDHLHTVTVQVMPHRIS
jgi:hypothetical protein